MRYLLTVVCVVVSVLNPAMHAASSAGFIEPLRYPAGDFVAAVAVADLNGDGKPDLVVGGTNAVSVLLRTDTGYGQPMAFATGAGPSSIATGDFNGDGHVDLVTTDLNSNMFISILLGNGDGTLQPHTDVPVGQNPFSVAVADFNRDGKQDLGGRHCLLCCRALGERRRYFPNRRAT